MSMQERIARAIFNFLAFYSGNLTTWDTVDSDTRDFMLIQARAVLTAIKEPPESKNGHAPVTCVQLKSPQDIWRDMINDALAETVNVSANKMAPAISQVH